MLIYLTGNTFHQVIKNTVAETEEVVVSKEVSNEIDFLKFAKQSITVLESVDILIIDVSVCINNDEEIIKALEMIRTMYDQIRIIVCAPYRATGDDFLTKCFNIGIWNIINTNDFVEIRNDLIKCIRTGKSFKEAMKYKDAKPEKVLVKHEIKKTVNRKLIGMVGTDSNIGVTHNAIILGNYFRKKGYMVALAEMNDSGDYRKIMEEYEEMEYEEGYFTFNGIDYYPECDSEKLPQIMNRSYNFIIVDFGKFEDTDMVSFEKCDNRIIIAGSKPWEYQKMNYVFSLYEDHEEALEKLIYCFNLTPKEDQEMIKKGMQPFSEQVHFLNYGENPFTFADFQDGDEIFADYLPEQAGEEKKKSIFGRFVKKEKKKVALS